MKNLTLSLLHPGSAFGFCYSSNLKILINPLSTMYVPLPGSPNSDCWTKLIDSRRCRPETPSVGAADQVGWAGFQSWNLRGPTSAHVFLASHLQSNCLHSSKSLWFLWPFLGSSHADTRRHVRHSELLTVGGAGGRGVGVGVVRTASNSHLSLKATPELSAVCPTLHREGRCRGKRRTDVSAESLCSEYLSGMHREASAFVRVNRQSAVTAV